MSNKNDNFNGKLENKGENGKEAMTMSTAVRLHKDAKSSLAHMDSYIAGIKRQAPSTAKREAIAALKRTGVLDQSGARKEKIVSWE